MDGTCAGICPGDTDGETLGLQCYRRLSHGLRNLHSIGPYNRHVDCSRSVAINIFVMHISGEEGDKNKEEDKDNHEEICRSLLTLHLILADMKE